MKRQARRGFGVPALSLALVCVGMAGSRRCAEAQSELGRGSGGNVAYPYGTSSSAGRSGVYSNRNSVGAGAGVAGASTAGMTGNPYAVPSMNPFLNPYASMYAPASPTNAALYFFAAQQSMGGIGSGQISGTRPGPASAPARSPIPDDRRVSDTPGAGAARYFNRSVKGGGIPNHHYSRYGNYYSANGH
jgi:hypothetical protein